MTTSFKITNTSTPPGLGAEPEHLLEVRGLREHSDGTWRVCPTGATVLKPGESVEAYAYKGYQFLTREVSAAQAAEALAASKLGAVDDDGSNSG